MNWYQERERKRCLAIQAARWRREDQEKKDAREAELARYREAVARGEIAPEPDADEPERGPTVPREPEWWRQQRLKREERDRQSSEFALARPDNRPTT